MRSLLCQCMTSGLVVSATLCCSRLVSAQAVGVQQPVVQRFGASTTVSVPDRGSTHLGSLGVASSGRVSSGRFRPGTSTGLERSASSLSVSVYIHDLLEMDEALLSQDASTGDVRDPWSARLNERRAATLRGVAQVPGESDAPKAARYEQLARDAEVKRKMSIARLHWQMAAKLGSSIAQKRLAESAPQ